MKNIERGPSALTVQVAEDLIAIRALRPEWDDLHGRTTEATGFQSFGWCSAWIDALCGEASIKPRIVVIRADARMVMLWPLQVEQVFGLRWARCIGQPVTQYGDALAEPSGDRAIWRALAEQEMRRWHDVDLLFISQVRQDGVLAGPEAPRRKQRNRAPALILSDCNQTGRNALDNRSLRRRESRLARAGNFTLETPMDPNQRRAFAAYILNLKEEWVRSKGYTRSSFCRPMSRRFLEQLAGNGTLEVHLLKVGADIVAGDLGLIGGNAYRSLISAYDLRYAYGSPGHILTRLLIERCRSRGLHCVDFLAPADASKMRIANATIGIDYFCKPLTFRGQAAALAVRYLRPLLHTVRVVRETWRTKRSRRVYLTSPRSQDAGT